MAATYKLITSFTLSSSASALTVSSIPSTYDDLSIYFRLRGSESYQTQCTVKFNNDSSSIYFYASGVGVRYGSGGGNGTYGTYGSAAQYINIQSSVTGTADPTQNYGYGELYIAQYKSSNWKSFLGKTAIQPQDYNRNQYTAFHGGTYRSTNAINSISFSASTGNIVAGSNVTIYGISKT